MSQHCNLFHAFINHANIMLYSYSLFVLYQFYQKYDFVYSYFDSVIFYASKHHLTHNSSWEIMIILTMDQ